MASAPGGGTHPDPYRGCMEMLSSMQALETSRRQEFIDRAMTDPGRLGGRPQMEGTEPETLAMDLLPLIIDQREWKAIEAGVLQRIRAFGAYVRDIHDRQEAVREGLLPPAIVFEDPAFHPELHQLPLDRGNPVTLGAVDLMRTPGGEWVVVEQRFSTPTGISHVIQIRRIFAQAMPELFEQLPVQPVASFAARLAEALAEKAPQPKEDAPLTILLSEGDHSPHFFEESFLARHMGIPLTHPQDVVVREGRVHLKTIEGLFPVDVIHRRLEPPLLDPVAFASANENGIPGLMACIRKGTVRVVNAPGCAVADNRALLRHADRLIRHYDRKAPLLRTIPTWYGRDPDQADWIADHLDTLELKTVCHPEILRRANPEVEAILDEEGLPGLLEKAPQFVVAQQIPETLPVPVSRRGTNRGLPARLRVYCLAGRRPFLLPGGLARLIQPEERTGKPPLPRRDVKDSWVLRPAAEKIRGRGRLEPEIRAGEVPLPSRAAEGFYWMGRYLERGRDNARMLNTLEELRWGELTPSERELYAPLWQAILKATGAADKSTGDAAFDPSSLVRQLLFDEGNPASARACFLATRNNAARIRSFVTPEVWRSLHGAVSLFPAAGSGHLGATRRREFIESVIESGDRVLGTAERTLLHDAGWQFLKIGMLLERGMNHVVIVGEVLPHIASRQWQHLRDDTDLTALLRLLGAFDAYHRSYRSRAYLDRVAQLLWMSPVCTASVRFVADSVAAALSAVDTVSRKAVTPPGLHGQIRAFRDWLEAIPLAGIFPARALELDRGLTRNNLTTVETLREAESCLSRMRDFFESLHTGLEDRFFSHHPNRPEDAS